MADFKITQLTDDIDFEHLPYWDVVIVGAGPAGLAASLTTAHRGLTTLVIEARPRPGGQPEFLYGHKRIADVPGFPDGVTGDELSERVFRQAANAKVQFRFCEEMTSIEDERPDDQSDQLFAVVTNKGAYRCRKVIIACGLFHFPLRLPALEALQSKKVYYKMPKIGDYDGQRAVVIGGGDSALDAAVMVLERHGQVELIVRSQIRGKASTLERILQGGSALHTSTEVTSAGFEGDQIRLRLSNGSDLSCDLIIVQIGYLSARETFEQLRLRLNEDGSIAVDQFFETSRSGIFAAGDVHGDIRLIPIAWAEGIQAAVYAFAEISRPYWLNEKRLHDQRIALIGDKMTQVAREAHLARSSPARQDDSR